MVTDLVHFLSIEAETGRATSFPRQELLAAASSWPGAGKRIRYTEPAEDLTKAGWGIVYPERVDPNVKEALAPLLELRKSQAGERFGELTYKRGEGVAQFLSRLRAGYGPVNPAKVPYYLLLVGDAEQIPHGFQAGLDIPHAVGRLVLPSIAAYSSYAETVCRAEAPASSPPRLALFSPQHLEDAGTADCVGRLTTHLISVFAGRNGGQLDRALVGQAATRSAFLELLLAQSPALIATAGHGVLYKESSEYQRQLQGSLVAADWSGLGAIELEHLIEPSAIPARVAGGKIFFLFGCYSGGTPRLNGYDMTRRADRRVLAKVPFVAMLPQVLLERGALAVIGHVDQACTDAFLWERHGQPEVFEDCLAAILDGHRLGFALETFGERFAQIAAEMITFKAGLGDGDDSGDLAEAALRLWTAYHDARGMVILGDPAVRLATSNPGAPELP